MAISSYLAYTTATLTDIEVATATGVDVYYYRLRWDDGSTWAGLAVQPVGRHHQSLDWFDPGGTLLDAPTRPEHRDPGGAAPGVLVGRGRRGRPVHAEFGLPAGARESDWWAVPSWLVILGLWHRPLRRASACVGLGSAPSGLASFAARHRLDRGPAELGRWMEWDSRARGKVGPTIARFGRCPSSTRKGVIMPELPWIGCELLRLEYDFQRQTAILYLHEGECVDMSMAVSFITKSTMTPV